MDPDNKRFGRGKTLILFCVSLWNRTSNLQSLYWLLQIFDNARVFICITSFCFTVKWISFHQVFAQMCSWLIYFPLQSLFCGCYLFQDVKVIFYCLLIFVWFLHPMDSWFILEKRKGLLMLCYNSGALHVA